MPGLAQTQRTDTVLAQGRQVAPLRARQVAAAQMSHPFRVSFDPQWNCVMLFLVVGSVMCSALHASLCICMGLCDQKLGARWLKEYWEEGK